MAISNPVNRLNKTNRRKVIRGSIIAGNIALLVIVGTFILYNRSASKTVRASTLSSAVATANSATDPLDTLSSAQIALTAAQITHMSELTAIRNQADSDSLVLSTPPSDSSILAKPQIVSTAQKSKKDIISYTTVGGDTVDSIAAKFGVSADSIRWSNNISGNNVGVNIKLAIPPVNGLVYTVKAGDTPASIAKKYSADEGQVIALNDAEINGLAAGDQIIVPNGRIAAVVSYGSYSSGIGAGSFAARYGGNGYDYGWCTYYVASRVSMPTNWGNANTWDNYAALSGWTVSRTPIAGAIAQTDGYSTIGTMHVAYVEEVSADGTMMKYSDMNGIAGWGRVGYSGWVPISTYEHYIYH
ncbi:LysM peptidoglycan-binding domain-containing protein [Candidatus Saccharibacteria bacterium]|nr:LysM peptidoglycan-binding domain-containing protein [Candidatus Saccharibacteria bacterium]